MTELIDDVILMSAPISEIAAARALDRLRDGAPRRRRDGGKERAVPLRGSFSPSSPPPRHGDGSCWNSIRSDGQRTTMAIAVDGLLIISRTIGSRILRRSSGGFRGETIDRGSARDRRPFRPLRRPRWTKATSEGVVGCFTEDGWLDSPIIGRHRARRGCVNSRVEDCSIAGGAARNSVMSSAIFASTSPATGPRALLSPRLRHRRRESPAAVSWRI